MSLTDGISFFELSEALARNGATATASSNSDNAVFTLNNNRFIGWESTGSDDMTTETLTVTLPASTEISRIFLVNHNFKQFQIQYGSSQDFTNVVSIDDSTPGTGISETDFERNTAYYEFDAVNTDTIVLTADTTQTADAEKSLKRFLITNEIGTLEGFPDVSTRLSQNIREERAISGRLNVVKGFETFGVDLSLDSYPLADDVALLDQVHERENPFMIWLNGGVPTNFNISQRGWRLEDIFTVASTRDLSNDYAQNLYPGGVDQRYRFEEVVENSF